MHWIPALLILPYFFLLLGIYRGLLKIKPFFLTTEPETFMSVVIACRNEQKNLPLLLYNIEAQNYPPELFEVIIVNDNSSDTTGEIASRYMGLNNCIVINNSGRGKKQAIRSGINASKGSLIITTDADCRMGQNWIRTIAAFYEKYKPEMIISPVKIESSSGFFGRFQELEFLSLQGVTAGTALSGEPSMCNGANLAFTREVYFKHSGNLHDEIPSGDDIFLLHSLKKDNSSKILWLESPDATITTSSSPSLTTFLTQRNRWVSKWKAYLDRFTILLGIVTFFSSLTLLTVLVSGFFIPQLLLVSLVAFVLKSVPDFLILRNVGIRYGKKNLLLWFFPSQVVYPFYVMFVVCYSLLNPNSLSTNSPFQKEI
jgi:cellulose synthase/poly-beta-1,6-N-acetylglucosamine synthase-like glycosyltransferase